MVSLGGLGYKFAGWEAAGGIWRRLGGREAGLGDPRLRKHAQGVVECLSVGVSSKLRKHGQEVVECLSGGLLQTCKQYLLQDSRL